MLRKCIALLCHRALHPATKIMLMLLCAPVALIVHVAGLAHVRQALPAPT
jgi:hypothetical protein